MDFFGRQEQARRASRWLVVAFIGAVGVVVIAVNAVVLFALMTWTTETAPFFISPLGWVEQHPALFWVTTLLVTMTIVGASVVKILQLQAGGRVVARDLGARLVRGDSTDPVQRRLLNVVEEMAIASSVPVPAVYILESPGINALAAGYTPSSASLVITRGAIRALDRSELQGVIGHEFSHILNGDMRLNTRLVGFLHGLFIVSELGRMLGSGRGEDSRVRLGGALGLAGVALFLVGLVGLFTGRLLQAAVSRQRERLADASAVQFTRESRGLRNALVKVGAHKVGSRLNHHGIDRVSHMLFASAGVLDFATHPPLLERIRALDPTFQSTEFGRMRYVLDAMEPPVAPVSEPSSGADRLGSLLGTVVPADADAVAGLVGRPGPREVQFAGSLHAALPAAVRNATADPVAAQGLLLAIAIGSRDQDERMAFVRLQLGDRVAAEAARSLDVAAALPVIQRLPAVLLMMGPLWRMSQADREQLMRVLNGLITRGGAPSIFGYALRKSAMTFLRDGLKAPSDARYLPVRSVREDLRVVLSVVARNGVDADPEAARRSFDMGWQQLGLPMAYPVEAATSWVAPLDRAIARLDRLAPHDKARVVRALTVTIAHDRRVTVAEAELLRLFCAQLHCPLPPLLASA